MSGIISTYWVLAAVLLAGLASYDLQAMARLRVSALKTCAEAMGGEAWSNRSPDSNRSFYDQLDYPSFVNQVKAVGLEDGADLHNGFTDVNIEAAVRAARMRQRQPVLVEIGAGYGRFVDAIRKRYPEMGIYAVERAQKYVHLLRENYLRDELVQVVDADVLQPFNLNVRADVATLMFSMLGEFRRREQELVLQNVRQVLEPGGIVLVDMIDPLQVAEVDSSDLLLQEYFWRVEQLIPPALQGAHLNVAATTESEIKLKLQAAGFVHMACHQYKTPSGSGRYVCAGMAR